MKGNVSSCFLIGTALWFCVPIFECPIGHASKTARPKIIGPYELHLSRPESYLSAHVWLLEFRKCDFCCNCFYLTLHLVESGLFNCGSTHIV